jgi:PDZ domain-containing secreted protein
VWVVVALVMLVAGAALYSPPFVVIEPGDAIDIGGDVTVSGTTTSPLNGRYLTATRFRSSRGSAP